MSKTTGVAAIVLSIQAIGLVSAWHQENQKQAAVERAARNGQSMFKLNGREVTMVGGVNSKDDAKACQIYLMDKATGDLNYQWTGIIGSFLFDGPHRFDIGDCHKLPKQVFLNSTNG